MKKNKNFKKSHLTHYGSGVANCWKKTKKIFHKNFQPKIFSLKKKFLPSSSLFSFHQFPAGTNIAKKKKNFSNVELNSLPQ